MLAVRKKLFDLCYWKPDSDPVLAHMSAMMCKLLKKNLV